MSSVPDAKVIAGNSITLQCGHSHQDISWYIEDSDVPIARGHKLTIHDASAKDEGKYHCAVEQGPKGSREVLVIGGYFQANCEITRALFCIFYTIVIV